MAACHNIAAKVTNKVAMHALAEAITEMKAKGAKEGVHQVEAEEAETARQAEEEAKVHQVADEAEAARVAEEEAKACQIADEVEAEATRQANTDAVAASIFPAMDSPITTPENPMLPFSALNTSTAPPSPVPDEEDELIEETVPPWLDWGSLLPLFVCIGE
ncbi:hypothetical protein BDQ17DRAFT_1431092 [Cyathus striatus]|nr:hypothetical protein BDQ17DRAFT_1431092 [Cyathus striatus]